MEVIGVRVEMPSNQPIVLLKEIDGSRFLPIWVGAVEATAIAFHDLTQNIVEQLDATLTAVHVTHIDEGVFYANLIVRDSSETTHTISARPSDAIALALRASANILASSELLDEIGIEIPSEGVPGDENQEVERFREFLDQINPEDFAG
ncbi:MAG: hypothetical protein RL690_316 [Actinomycetota bacterium]